MCLNSESDDGDSHPSREYHMVQLMPVLICDGAEQKNPATDAPEEATVAGT